MDYEKSIELYGDGIGRVDYVESMGSDLTIVNSARVSFGTQKEELDGRDRKLINYLAKHKWNDNQTWGRKVEIPAGLVKTFAKPTRRAAPGCRARTYPQKALSKWQELGIRRLGGRDLPARELKAALVLPDGPTGKDAYLVYKNYSAIMAYNCAHLYAVTVGTLGDLIQGELRK